MRCLMSEPQVKVKVHFFRPPSQQPQQSGWSFRRWMDTARMMGEIKNKSTINVQKWDQDQELFKYLFFFLKYSSHSSYVVLMEWTPWLNTRSSCHKKAASRKKAASQTWVPKSNEKEIQIFVVLGCNFTLLCSYFSLKGRPHSACQFLTSVTPLWAVEF